LSSNKPEYLHFFDKKQVYSNSSLKIRILKNVFISHWGILLKNGLIPLKSAENLVGFYDKTFYFKHWRRAIEQYLVCRFGKSLSSILVDDDKQYFTINTPWFGYFSWFTTNLPRLIMVQETFPGAVLLLPEKIGTMPFVSDSLKMFPNINVVEVKDEHHIFVKNYIFAEVRPWTSQFDVNVLEKVRSVCFDYLDKAKISVDEIKYVYVSRKKAMRRKIANELELEQYLYSKGFESICFEDHSVFEQIAMMRRAKVVISLHGAGLTNTIFIGSGSSVLELSPIPDKESQFRFPFWRICDLLKINYQIQFCKTIDKGETDIYTRDVTVDIELFKQKVNSLL
jgi:hypothetical protein